MRKKKNIPKPRLKLPDLQTELEKIKQTIEGLAYQIKQVNNEVGETLCLIHDKMEALHIPNLDPNRLIINEHDKISLYQQDELKYYAFELATGIMKRRPKTIELITIIIRHTPTGRIIYYDSSLETKNTNEILAAVINKTAPQAGTTPA